MGRLSLSVGLENGPERKTYVCLIQSLTPYNFSKYAAHDHTLHSAASDQDLHYFVNVPVQVLQKTLSTLHSDVTATRIARLWITVTVTMITLVDDNHVDSYVREILAFVYYGSIVKTPKRNLFPSCCTSVPSVYHATFDHLSSLFIQRLATYGEIMACNLRWDNVYTFRYVHFVETQKSEKGSAQGEGNKNYYMYVNSNIEIVLFE